MQAGTPPKKRTSLNGRAALKLMRLDGVRRADQAASDARVTKAGASIAVALLLISSAQAPPNASRRPATMASGGRIESWTLSDAGIRAALAAPGTCCTGPGNRRRQSRPARTPATARPLHRQSHRSSPPRSSTQPEGGLDRVDPGADEQGASDGRAPAVFARAAAIASQADEAVEVVDAALDRSSHRNRAGGLVQIDSRKRPQFAAVPVRTNSLNFYPSIISATWRSMARSARPVFGSIVAAK